MVRWDHLQGSGVGAPGPSLYRETGVGAPASLTRLLASDLDDLDHEAGESDAEHRDRNCSFKFDIKHLLSVGGLDWPRSRPCPG